MGSWNKNSKFHHSKTLSLPFFGQFSGKEKSKLCPTKSGKIIL
ncbi:MAG: hypothetical protein ACJAZX_001115 [Rickettsiales bacterium]|jgi:hypothetical protein